MDHVIKMAVLCFCFTERKNQKCDCLEDMIFFLLIVLVCIVCSLDVGMGVPVQQVSNFQLLVGLVSVFVFLFLISYKRDYLKSH